MKKRSRPAARKRRQSSRRQSKRARRSSDLDRLDTSAHTEPSRQAVCPSCNALLPFSQYLGAPTHCTEPALHLKEVVSLLHDSDRRTLMPWFPGQQRYLQLRRCIRIFKPYERQMAKRADPARRSGVIMRADSESPGIEPYVSEELIADCRNTEYPPSPVEPYILDEMLPEYMEMKPSQPEAEQDMLNLYSDLPSSSWLVLRNDPEAFEEWDDDLNGWTLLCQISDIPEPLPPQNRDARQDAQSCTQPEADASQYDANVAENGSHLTTATIDDWWGWH